MRGHSGWIAAAVVLAAGAAASACSVNATAATARATHAAARVSGIATTESTAPPKPVPASIADLPLGPAPRIPYVTTPTSPDGQPGRSSLHIDGQTLPFGETESAGDTVLIGDDSGGHYRWKTVRHGRLVSLPYLTGQSMPALSPDGRKVLSIDERGPGTLRLAVYDVRADAEIAHVDVTKADGAPPPGSAPQDRAPVAGFDATGAVYVIYQPSAQASSDVVLRWRPRDDATPMTVVGPGRGTFQVVPAGLIRDPLVGRSALDPLPDKANHDTLWEPRADGTYGPTGIALPTTDVQDRDLWSPDGRRVTYSDGVLRAVGKPARRVGPPSVLDLRTGVITPLGVPSDVVFTEEVAFEDATHVLLFASPVLDWSGAVLLRCPTDGSACERVAGPHGRDVGFAVVEQATLPAGHNYDADDSH